MRNMTTFKDIEESKKSDFMDMVDKMVMMSDYDPELKDVIKYLDEQAKKTDSSIYEIIYVVADKHFLNKRVQEWREARNNNKFL